MKKVALIGAGAVGGYIIWGFDGSDAAEFTLIADGDRKERLKENGVKINGKIYHPTVMSPKEAGPQDLIFVATKYGGLDSAIEMLPALCGEHSLVLSLLNGVDSEERIANKIGWEHVEYSLMRIASKRVGDEIVFNPENTWGVFAGKEKMSAEITSILDKTRVKYTLVDNALREVWVKFASNIANNLPQAVLGVDASLYMDSEHGLFIATKLWDECYVVAQAKGIDIGKEPYIFKEVPKTSKYSTLQDLEAKRHTEIDMLAGQLMKMAAEHGINVPYAEYTYHAIKALEEKNDGIIGM